MIRPVQARGKQNMSYWISEPEAQLGKQACVPGVKNQDEAIILKSTNHERSRGNPERLLDYRLYKAKYAGRYQTVFGWHQKCFHLLRLTGNGMNILTYESIYALLFFCVVGNCVVTKWTQSRHNLNISWPIKRVAEIEGDIVLGGLMMVHEREDLLTCGPIMPQGGIQALECMLYTIDWVNSQKDFLPNITLGAYVLDDCDKDTYGLEQAVDFIKVLKMPLQFLSKLYFKENFRVS
ncbi:uncharacterized protein LOC111637762 [Centruroides sculpturatus]|uniref:uncharacterized protein LOC111637762 n=1 Tax=Centruroides sculpturatus TaxID=218467 RepID=UPI000C6C8EC8|nr:uncharacterized protein LOC111637762 [Centruroides sculpturatus]